MLKQQKLQDKNHLILPAAFRRLCVETFVNFMTSHFFKPAAFRRLCVETETVKKTAEQGSASRLQAAVC